MSGNRLGNTWNARVAENAIDPVMRFTDEGLVLGAGTVLVRSAGSSREITIDPTDPRLKALLSAAHLGQPTTVALTHLRKAADCWRAGEDALAAMHLALSRLDRLPEPERDAHRLFLAEALLAVGVGPEAIIRVAQSSLASLEDLYRFDPNEPRVPAGSGRTSGRWTTAENSAGPSTAGGQEESVQPHQGAPRESNPTHQAELVSEPEVNPNTITPSVNIHSTKQDPEACYIAKMECSNYFLRESWRGNANNNLDISEGSPYSQCATFKGICDRIEDLVWDSDKFNRGVIVFPDGGVVVVAKGAVPTFYPREIAVLKWPRLRRIVPYKKLNKLGDRHG